jgi:TonB family protein
MSTLTSIRDRSAQRDQNFAGVSTITFHALVILALILGMRSCGEEAGGGGGNGGNGTDYMELAVAGLGNDVDGWGEAPTSPDASATAPTETAPQTADLSQSESAVTTSGNDTPVPNQTQQQTRPNNTQTQQTQQTQQTSSQLNNLLNNMNKGGSGNTSGNGQQGNPDGQVDGRGALNGGGSPGSGGGSGGGNGGGIGGGNGLFQGFSLGVRTIRQKPTLNDSFSDEGKVLVDIMVDRMGNVISAVPNPGGSNTTSARLYELAVKAAKNAKFNVVDNAVNQRGTITIQFKLK